MASITPADKPQAEAHYSRMMIYPAGVLAAAVGLIVAFVDPLGWELAHVGTIIGLAVFLACIGGACAGDVWRHRKRR